MASSKDREALLLTMSADIRTLQKSIDKMNGVSDAGFDKMEKRAFDAARAVEKSLGDIKLPKKLAKELNDFGADLGSGLRDASRSAQIAVAAISAFAIKSAADAEDINSAFTETFGSLARQGEAVAAKIAEDFSRSVVDVKNNMNTLQQVMKGLGLSSEQAFKATEALAARTIDLASNKNISDARAAQAILSGLTGETDALKGLGVVITDASTKAELLKMGFKGNVDQASEAAKATARLNLILEKTAFAQGDVARTSDGANNKLKALQSEAKDAAIELGTQLLPAFIQVAEGATDALKAFNDMPAGVQLAGLALLGFIAAGGPVAGLLANLAKVIDLANKTRLALAGVTGAGAAAGAAGAGGGVLAAAGGVAVTAGTAAAVLSLGGDAGRVSGQAILNERLKDEVRIRKTIAELEGKSGASAERKLAFWRQQLAAAQEEIRTLRAQDRAERISANRAEQRKKTAKAPDSSVVGGFTLAPADKTGGDGKRGGKKLKATAVSGPRAAPINESSLLIVDEKSVVDLAELLMRPVTANANPDGFVAAEDAVIPGAAELREYQDRLYDRTYDGIRGALEAAGRDGADGFGEYLKYAVRNRLLDALADLATGFLTKQRGGSSLVERGGSIAKLLGFAGGGNPPVGRPYVVGENGPEIRVDRAASTILPNNVLRALQGGVPARAPATTVNQFRLDLSGAVITQDLLDQVNTLVMTGGIQSTMAARTMARSDFARKARNVIP